VLCCVKEICNNIRYSYNIGKIPNLLNKFPLDCAKLNNIRVKLNTEINKILTFLIAFEILYINIKFYHLYFMMQNIFVLHMKTLAIR